MYLLNFRGWIKDKVKFEKKMFTSYVFKELRTIKIVS